ncbi:TonB-dependent siderophore receptor [Halomonas organivorans]|uniref:Iron complex outermembrane receptor protein n=1 Tax=Halomonas organivorans TaxID=257772 RepID=A0A7W5G5H5_9GAMM|nr:TonB-dependent siderophore receptor [Halomonas organivorans]MBB3141513.1 iron complex outermembrane receptor protein [Halomonas organivorans]
MRASSRPWRLSPLTAAVRYGLGLSLVGASSLALAQDDAAEMASDTLVVSATALKVATPLVETPRPVSTVEREELDERNVQRLDETFRYRAGVLSGHYGADNDTDWFKVRGFDQSTYQDGLRIYRTGYYQWLPEPYGLQSVDVFKGPSSILYGEAPAGGLINAVSKRPTAERQGEIELQFGNRDHRQFAFDTSGPATESGDVRYRLVGLYKERDGDLDHTDNERYYFAPSLAVDLSDDTSVTFLASVQKDDGVPTNPFKLLYGTVQDTPFGKVDPQTSYGEPDYDKNERTQASIGYELRHRLDDTWRFEQNLRYSHMDLALRSTYVLAQLDERTAGRGLVYRDGEIDSWTMDNRLIGNWYTDRTENTLLLGVGYQDLGLEGKEADPYPFGSPIDIFDPQYGNFTPVSEDQLTDRKIDKQQTGLYVQDQLRIDDRWVLLGSVRYDQAQTDNVDRTAGTTQRADDDQVSWSGGVMYLGANGINPYLSYTESFEPQASVDDDGRLYEPLEGEQWEAGIKVAPPGWDGYVTAAVFDLEQRNSLVTSPDGGRQEQSGKQTSRGFELEGVGYLTDQLQLTAAYTYTDAEDEDDQRKSLIPRHQASTWLDYAFQEGALQGLKLGGGVRYVGGSVYGDVSVPEYTLVDAMARYDFAGSWRAQVNVNNLTDKEYIASCDYWCYYGESRSVIGSLSYRF